MCFSFPSIKRKVPWFLMKFARFSTKPPKIMPLSFSLWDVFVNYCLFILSFHRQGGYDIDRTCIHEASCTRSIMRDQPLHPSLKRVSVPLVYGLEQIFISNFFSIKLSANTEQLMPGLMRDLIWNYCQNGRVAR